MSFFDGIKKLFGEGKIRVIGETSDGRSFTAKVPYIGSVGTITEKEFLEDVANTIYVEKGVTVTRLKVDGGYGTTADQPDWTGRWFVPHRTVGSY